MIPPILYAPLVLVAWLLGLWLLKRVVIRRLRNWKPKSSTVSWAQLLIEAISFPANFLILASGLAIFTNILPLADKYSHWANMALQGSVIVAIVIFLDKLLRGILDEYAAQSLFTRASHGITKGLIRAFIIGIGFLIFLDLIGISITPILASLGIGSLAVALALQDTLTNFFSGLYVAIDKPVKINDLIRLETGQEGTVMDIGWRSARLRTKENNVIIIPNSKLTSSVITILLNKD